jgi:hypothetical protein
VREEHVELPVHRLDVLAELDEPGLGYLGLVAEERMDHVESLVRCLDRLGWDVPFGDEALSGDAVKLGEGRDVLELDGLTGDPV